MLGLVVLLIFHTQKLSAYFRENIAMSVAMHDKATEAEILNFKYELDTKYFVKSAVYISKAEAAARLKADLGENFVEFIGYNPLPSTIEIKLHQQYTQPDSLAKIEIMLSKHNLVKQIDYQKSLMDLIDKNISTISKGILIFSGLLLFISIILIHNTIRLAIYSKRMLIKSMLLVGATQAFIRRPFIINGFFQGFISGLISLGLLLMVLIFTNNKLPELELLNDPAILILLAVSIVLFGTLITWLSNYIAVKKYLKLNSEDLY
jgi:cell division transport system permease protein